MSREAIIAPRRRWVFYVAAVWAVLFGAPHVWWALGIPFGMPGGLATYEVMTSSWRLAFIWLVIALCVLAFMVAMSLAGRFRPVMPQRLSRVLAWIACGMLSFRGLGGAIIDGTSDPMWWQTFLIGGILFGASAGLSRSATALN